MGCSWDVSSSASPTAHSMIPTKLVLSLWFISLHVNSEPFFNFARDILARRHSDFPLLPAQITSGKPYNLKLCARNTYCIFQKANKSAFINVCLGLPYSSWSVSTTVLWNLKVKEKSFPLNLNTSIMHALAPRYGWKSVFPYQIQR